MTDFEINYDARPYIPDIFIKDDIYKSFDAVDNNNNIGINSTIFVFNINEPLNSIYNDPEYLLFGKKKSATTYDYPSLNFFNHSNTLTNSSIDLSNSSVSEYTITNNLRNILISIGYNVDNINESQFEYRKITLVEYMTSTKIEILYFYFNFKLDYIPNETNYNIYASTTYYDDKYWNILIYPYTINNSHTPCEISYNYNYFIQAKTNNDRIIDKIDFDDRECIGYYNKIDYKHLEKKNNMGKKTGLVTLKNYSYVIKNYCKFISEQKNKMVINIGLNEICKLYYGTTDNVAKNESTYTITELNNKHINNYISYCNNNNKYSFSSDNKLGNLNQIPYEQKKYSCYEYSIVNNPTTYQMVKNFYLNSYWDINEFKYENSSSIINYNLYKIFLLINPKIIDENYLLNNVSTNVMPLFAGSNILEFGTDINKLKLYMCGNIKYTDIYYINKYKITFEFIDDNQNTWSWIIILGIAFYNSDKICILNTNATKSMKQLGYANYTTLEQSITLSPTISNFLNSVGKICEEMSSLNITNVKKYSFTFSYDFLSHYPNQNNLIKFTNFYFYIPNVRLGLLTPSKKPYSNVLNVIMSKINNLISNTININDNMFNFKNGNDQIKNYLTNVISFDNNIILCNCEQNQTQEKSSDSFDSTYCECISELNNWDKTKYIEYFNYFPTIYPDYLDIGENFVGKYTKVILYPYSSETINSFGPIPTGKYLKFNHVNWKSTYPPVITEDFVKSIKTIKDITNYNYSMLIALPYNLNQDNDFYCSSPEYFFTSEYAMNIGGSHTMIYLILTDYNSNPYQFYNTEPNPNPELNFKLNNIGKNATEPQGVIYGIKLFNNSNYIANNMNLKLALNLYYNKYINLTQMLIMSETYMIYSDSNNVVWNINETFLNKHNSEYLKEIVNYDFNRFLNCYDMAKIQEYYNTFNYKFFDLLYENKYELNKLSYSAKVLIYTENLYKCIGLLKKIHSYCEIIRINIMLNVLNNNTLIQIIKYNIGIVSNLLEVNYDLNICSGTFNTEVYAEITKIYSIDTRNSLENINDYIISCDYVINYSTTKLNGILKLLNSNAELNPESNTYYNIYDEIYNEICLDQINFWLGVEIEQDIKKLIHDTSIVIFNGLGIDVMRRKLLLEQLGAFIYACVSNLTKIDELYNLAKLMANSSVNDYLPLNLNNIVVKDNYIYNTTCYTSQSNVPVFSIITFLTNTYDLINKLSSSITNPDSYTNYVKAIQEGILINITNTIQYFQDIINKIVHVYNYMRNVFDPSSINIFDPMEIGDFYNLLVEFELNFQAFFNILYSNQINLFYEYDYLQKSLTNLLYSCEEFLLYVRLWNDFMNPNTLAYSDIYVCEDLYKIIHTDVFYDFLTKSLNSFYSVLITQEPVQTLYYMNKINEMQIKKFAQPFEKNLIILINKIILGLENEIRTGIPIGIQIVYYNSYYIVPYQDLLLFKEKFNWASWNFNSEVLDIISTINKLNSIIFTTYYTDPKVNVFYTQALNYTYLKVPFGYININNTIINS